MVLGVVHPDVSNSFGSWKVLPHQELETCGAICSFRADDFPKSSGGLKAAGRPVWSVCSDDFEFVRTLIEPHMRKP